MIKVYKLVRNVLCTFGLFVPLMGWGQSVKDYPAYVVTERMMQGNQSLASLHIPCNLGIGNLVQGDRLNRLKKEVKRILDDKQLKVAYLYASGSASPDGSVQLNTQLAGHRLEALTAWLRSEVGVGTLPIKTVNKAEDWEALEQILSLSPWAGSTEVLRILRQESDDEIREERIKALDSGETWNWLVQTIFPSLRNASLLIVCRDNEPAEQPRQAEVPANQVQQLELVEAETVQALSAESPVKDETAAVAESSVLSDATKEGQWVIIVKTNALALAGLMANAGVEVGFAPHWSLDVPFYYSNYNLFSENRMFRFVAVQPELRYWFKGVGGAHFVGLHGHVGQFDIALTDRARYQSPDAYWGMGLSYGYALPLGKTQRWRLEFNLGAGFTCYDYEKFQNNISTRYAQLIGVYDDNCHWGVTRAAISVGYKLFGSKTKNER